MIEVRSQTPAPDEMVRPPSTSTRPWIALGLLIVVALFGGLGSWAAQAPLEGAVIGPSVVSLISNRKTVKHLEGGIVSEIHVREGDSVEVGELLIRLDETRSGAGLAILEAELDLLRAREARLEAERDGRDAIEFAETFHAPADSPNLRSMLDGQRQLFEARQNALLGETEILTQRAEQLGDEIQGLEAQKRSKQREIAIIGEELRGLRKLFERGYAPRTRIRELERDLARLSGEIGEHTADIARAEKGIGEARLQVIQLEKEFRQQVVDELHEVQARIFDVSQRRTAALDELSRLEIRAPRAGTVVGLNVHTVGGVLAAGEPVLQIVPQDDELVVDAHVQPRDIDKVTVGQTAVVRLTAFDLRSTPELTGMVISVSADRFEDRATGGGYYLVRSRIPEAELAQLGDLRLVPGMPAETFIHTGSRTVLSYLVKPLSDGLARAFKDQ